MSEQDEVIGRLKELIRKHRVCYEVLPEYLPVKGRKEKVGFELTLCGTNSHEAGHALPGCEQCRETFHDLSRIAAWIMPTDDRASRYENDAYDQALHSTQKRGFRPEVTLTINILHRHGFDQPVDECEERCLKEMRAKLAELGVSEGHWRESD